MLDDIVSNKYFVIALIIALIVLLFLYSQKGFCPNSKEGMRTLDIMRIKATIDDDNNDDGTKLLTIHAPPHPAPSTYPSPNTLPLPGVHPPVPSSIHAPAPSYIKKKIPQPFDTWFEYTPYKSCNCPTNNDNNNQTNDTNDTNDFYNIYAVYTLKN